MIRGMRPLCALAMYALAWGLACFTLAGCQPSGPGLENKPPPKGGPAGSPRRPPGEVSGPATR